MNLVDRTGTFRGVAVDWGVNKSSNGYMRVEAKFQAMEYYDEKAEVWVAWDEYGQEITAYMMLQSGPGKKDPLWVKQIMTVFGWNGNSFLELNHIDYSDIKFQFRVAENTYEDNTTMQYEWIDEYDVEPGRRVQKLSDADLKALDKAFGKVQAATKKAKAPASVGKKTPPKAPAKTPPKAPAAKNLLGGCTKDEAWDYLTASPEMVNPECTEDHLANFWLDAIEEIGGATTAEADLTPEQWMEIKELVAKKYFKF